MPHTCDEEQQRADPAERDSGSKHNRELALQATAQLRLVGSKFVDQRWEVGHAGGDQLRDRELLLT
jgi:hypothetical protein